MRARFTRIEMLVCMIGAALVSAGVALVFVPAGMIVAGILLLAAGLLLFDQPAPATRPGER